MIPEFITVQVEDVDLPRVRRLLIGKGNLLIQGNQLTMPPTQKTLLDQAGIKYHVVEPESP